MSGVVSKVSVSELFGRRLYHSLEGIIELLVIEDGVRVQINQNQWSSLLSTTETLKMLTVVVNEGC